MRIVRTRRRELVLSAGLLALAVAGAAVVLPPALRRAPTLDGLDLAVPWERVKGHLLVTEPTPVHLPGIVAPVATQLEDGRLLVGGTFDTGDESPVVRPEIIDSILAGLYATLWTSLVCPLRVSRFWPVAASHTFTVLSWPPETMCLQSGLYATLRTTCVCP